MYICMLALAPIVPCCLEPYIWTFHPGSSTFVRNTYYVLLEEITRHAKVKNKEHFGKLRSKEIIG